jgi:multiple sugar transport system permease protein
MMDNARTVVSPTRSGATAAIENGVPRASGMRRHAALLRVENRDGWLMALPFIVGVLFLWAAPMFYSLWLVLNQWSVVSAPKFIGLGNFERLISDELVAKSLWNTAYYTFLGVPLRLIVAFALALLLNQQVRGLALFRTLFYLPSITPAVASAIIWVQLLDPKFGAVNRILGWFGVPNIAWLFNPVYTKPAFIMMSLWTVGPAMIIFLAALQNTPKELLEAAEIDGANTWERFRSITIPMVSPVILFNLTMGIIGSFQVFATAFVMTGGGPQNATLFMVLYIYRVGFGNFQMGYAAALSWLLFALIMLVTLVQLKISDRYVYYEVG